MPFYAVCHGKKRGVFEKYSDCQESINKFPQPVFKKFDTKEEADNFLKEHKIERVSLEVDDKSLDKYYSVARGKVGGIFTDYEEVKKHIADYPKPLYKKHSSYNEALAYFNKFNKGEVEEKKSDEDDAKESTSKRTKRSSTEVAKKDSEVAGGDEEVPKKKKTK